MAAYYNENDEFAADWLRNLIKAGLIADGEVDTRSIVDVRPGDLRGFTQCHFFAGIGGWSYALRKAGWDDSRPAWTGSCPCQPFSLAGAQRGFADERHLWPVWRELIRECSPAIVFGEQVASATEWLGLVRGDLETMGYAVGAAPIQAASAGADHLRDRYWFVADGQGERGWAGLREGGAIENRDGAARGGGVVELADANDAGSQGWGLLSERAGERAAGPDGLADADQLGASSERQQRSRQQCGPGCDPEPCDGGNLAEPHLADQRRHAGRSRGETGQGSGEARAAHGDASDGSCASGFEWVIGADGKARRVKSGIRLLAHGVPNRVGLLRGFGNAIDPRPAAAFIEAYMTACTVPSHQRGGQ